MNRSAHWIDRAINHKTQKVMGALKMKFYLPKGITAKRWHQFVRNEFVFGNLLKDETW
jgi:hypothetical protein